MVAALVFVLVGVGSLRSLIGPRHEAWVVTILCWVLLAAVCGALYFSRRRPVAVAFFVLAATICHYLVSAYDGPLLVAFIVALYWVAAEGHLWAAIGLASLAVILTGAGTLSGNEDVNGVALFMLVGWLVAVVAVGWVRYGHQAYALEREQRAATEERLRIARELHDVVGHHLSLINVQSAAALRRLTRYPERGTAQAEEALGAVKEASGEALRELRSTLGLLRRDGEEAPTAPAAGLDRIGDLVASARVAGLEVRTRVTGEPVPLPTEVDLAAYRIVQESLTNVTRHARAREVVISVEHAPGLVAVEVSDDGRGPAENTTGTGIMGMRERARALGGDLTAGPREGGGFTVRARFPHENGARR
ncbi:sensor histidine kinase [Actinocorallia populi]|uniref:sensor histidine kinase n=1 Tax=Actinocorallia populi TaxID=2079200 RepID=UPI001E63C5DE|nr:sensor histidine kinase [Actinocorallia populi]